MNELPTISRRAAETHKGDFGRVVVVGGSRGMSGAPALAAMAALRSGAGLVTAATADVCQDVVAGFNPSLMTRGLPADPAGRIEVDSQELLMELSPDFDVLAVGPGLGVSSSLQRLVNELYEQCPKPLVLDADGLNCLSSSDWQSVRSSQPRILTPHPGEFRRLTSKDDYRDRAEMEASAIDLARTTGTVIVLKGHRSLITDGDNHYHNQSGNPGMATGGSGDVLTGIIAALIGQGFSDLDAARLGCHLHGRAGDLAADELGEISMIAADLIDYLPDAIQESSAD